MNLDWDLELGLGPGTQIETRTCIGTRNLEFRTWGVGWNSDWNLEFSFGLELGTCFGTWNLDGDLEHGWELVTWIET